MLFPMSISLNNIGSIIFDFDYTLVDSSPVIVECISFALRKMGLSVPTPEFICRTISQSPKDALKALINTDDSNKAEEFRLLVNQREDEIMLDGTVLLDGVKHVLSELSSRSLGLGIVSNKYRHRIEAFLSREKLQDMIEVIVGFEDTPKPKPDPAGLLIAMNRLGRSQMQTVYVGDSLVDAETARRSGISFIAVLTGMASREDFKNYSPSFIINNLNGLLELL